MQQTIKFPSAEVVYYFNSTINSLWDTYDQSNSVIITTEPLTKLYPELARNHKILVIPPAESSKDMNIIARLARQLLEMEVTRKTTIIGIGGGVVTDVTGFLAATYMRGVPFGFVPTTLLGMVDAAVGGKNGVNVGMNKNILGTITQPRFILYDTSFLDTLPDDEWSNGFAEIIKYACIFDAEMFEELGSHNISYYKDRDNDALDKLIERCVNWKNKTVLEDEKETGLRKLLNFGHTAAHAIENLYELPHGKAVGIGMVIACMVSADVAGLDKAVTGKLRDLLAQYHLPVRINLNAARAMEILRMDKKRHDDMIDYIILQQPGKAAIRELPIDVIAKSLSKYEREG